MPSGMRICSKRVALQQLAQKVLHALAAGDAHAADGPARHVGEAHGAAGLRDLLRRGAAGVGRRHDGSRADARDAVDGNPFSSRTLSTPMCANPRAKPPPSANPRRMGAGTAAVHGSDTPARGRRPSADFQLLHSIFKSPPPFHTPDGLPLFWMRTHFARFLAALFLCLFLLTPACRASAVFRHARHRAVARKAERTGQRADDRRASRR